jgi:hypothetical protein
MEDEQKVTNPGEQTPAELTPENKDTKDIGKTDDDGMIPRHRLNESEQKRKEAENRAAEAAKTVEQLNSKFSALEQALRGADSKGERDEMIGAFEKQFNLQGTGFVDGLLSLAEKKLSKSQQQDPAVLEAVLEVKFNKEFDSLVDEIPDADKLTREERTELKKRAFSKEFMRTPLKTIYRDMTYDKRGTVEKTFEDSRSGGRSPSDNGEPNFGKMSVDEMREWSAKNLTTRRRR